MSKISLSVLVLFALLLSSSTCSDTNPVPPANDAYYFPPIGSDVWETKTASSIGWDATKLQEAINYAASVNTYGLIILHKGKIVTENYWGGWNMDTRYPIASAGKSITAFLVGCAQKEGFLNINNKTSQYLGTGWTSAPAAKEDLITVKNQLSMTTGLEDNVPDDNCQTPSCLQYKVDAGTRWAYHNAPYRLLQNVVANATGSTYNNYTKTRLADKIGMKNYTWFNYILWLNTRDMAKFGSLSLQKGNWNGTNILNDAAYFADMTRGSQTINNSYGYLWWLNGKLSYMVPTSQIVFPGSLAPSAPIDMISCLGKGDKKIYVIPSLDIVVVRHGDDTGTNVLGPSSFDEFFWQKLKLAIRY
jgi:CubicO group peptidase (beta-lactamase class C family)